jgi:hypothetical protein
MSCAILRMVKPMIQGFCCVSYAPAISAIAFPQAAVMAALMATL